MKGDVVNNKISCGMGKVLIWWLVFTWYPCCQIFSQNLTNPPAPLFTDPIYDGPADPVVFFERELGVWVMLYSQRRSNMDAPDVSYCYNTKIGVASSDNNGQTWVYRGTLDLEFENGENTFWAPDAVYFNDSIHLFVTYIRGGRSHWGGDAGIAHYTGKDIRHLRFKGMLSIGSKKIIDPCLFQLSDGTWKMWFKDENRQNDIMVANSLNLFNWEMEIMPAIQGNQEGPSVFKFGEFYWMLTDEWSGMRVYKSNDLINWEKQGKILEHPSRRFQDKPSGAHGDVVVMRDKAYIFYFTHPGRAKHTEAPADINGIISYNLRRSVIQVALLQIKNNTLVCDRDSPFNLWLPAEEIND